MQDSNDNNRREPVTNFSQMLALCGLSDEEGAQYLNTSVHVIKLWAGNNRVPGEKFVQKLAGLYGEMEDYADNLANDIADENIGAWPSAYAGGSAWPSERCARTVESMAMLRILLKSARIKKNVSV